MPIQLQLPTSEAWSRSCDNFCVFQNMECIECVCETVPASAKLHMVPQLALAIRSKNMNDLDYMLQVRIGIATEVNW